MSTITKTLLFTVLNYNSLKNKNIYTILHNSDICRLIYLLLFHLSFMICDIYFAINNCHTQIIVIDIKVYFIIDALIESIWLIFMSTLIFLRKSINLHNKFHSRTVACYYILVFYWNIVGIFILLDLSNYSCRNYSHNYLFIKIIMTSINLLSLFLAMILILKFMDIILNSNIRNNYIQQ